MSVISGKSVFEITSEWLSKHSVDWTPIVRNVDNSLLVVCLRIIKVSHEVVGVQVFIVDIGIKHSVLLLR